MSHAKAPDGVRKARVGDRTMVACVSCKEKKQKCDGQVPACGNCARLGRPCFVEDPATKRRQPRNYLQSLEERVAMLEGMLQQVRPELAVDHLQPGFSPRSDDCNQQVNAHTLESSSSAPLLLTTQLESAESPAIDDDLSSKVSLLSLNAPGGEPHYLGSTSAYAFSRVLNPTLRSLAFSTGGESNSNDDYSQWLPCSLPSPTLGAALAEAYFENIHPQYPFLHRATFEDWQERLLTNIDEVDATTLNPVILFFINIVYAIGATLLPHLGFSPIRFYISSQLYADYTLQMDSLESIQALLCFIMYSLRSAAGVSIWKLSGLALRQCVELGYHRSAGSSYSVLDALQLEMRKRVFWVAYGIDRASAVTLGRPFCLADEEIDVEYPLNINDTQITSSGISGMTTNFAGSPQTDMSRAIHTFRLRRLWSLIHVSFYSPMKIKDPDKAAQLAQTEQVYNQLLEWHNTTPTLDKNDNRAVLSVFGSDEWFRLGYHQTVLLLYRGRLLQPESSGIYNLDVFTRCSRSASEICHGYRRLYLGKPISYTWGALQIVFVAGLTYLHCLWVSSSLREASRHDEISSTCTACTMVLVVIAERWPAANSYRDIFERLASKTISMVVDRNQERMANLQVPLFSSGRGEMMSSSVNEWLTDVTNSGMSDEMEILLTGFVGNFRPTAGEGGDICLG